MLDFLWGILINKNNKMNIRPHNSKYKTRHIKSFPYCSHCGYEVVYQNAILDHIKSLGDGGLDVFENTQLLCRNCDFSKTSLESKKELLRLTTIKTEAIRVKDGWYLIKESKDIFKTLLKEQKNNSKVFQQNLRDYRKLVNKNTK